MAEAELNAGNVRARILNNGAMFWRGSPHVYEVPKGGGVNAIFASNLVIGGMVDGELRMAGSTYGPYEFWAGPLNDDGSPPQDCARYDRIWSISRADVLAYEESGHLTPGLADWPTGLGAPTVDSEGNELDFLSLPLALRVDRKIDLKTGERPLFKGDQMLWWIMNDQGNIHNRTDGPPIGLEVHASAFSFAKGGALGNTTFFSLKLRKPHGSPLEQAYIAINQDSDLGNFQDDYVGSDSLLGLAYTYNADNFDEGSEGYGEAPPASGLDFFRGPVTDDDGLDNDLDGEVDEPGERKGMSAFVSYSGGSGVQGDPGNAENFYTLMRGLWKNGDPVTYGGNGRGFSSIPAPFSYTAMPPAYWSEFDVDGRGTAQSTADRRFIASTGPFTMGRGRDQEILFGMLTSFGADNLDSVRRLKADDAFIQGLVDSDFAAPPRPDAPVVTATPRDGAVLVEWDNPPSSNNYREGYAVLDPFTSENGTDQIYRFEGYRVLAFENAFDTKGRVIATFDLDNSIRYQATPNGPINIGTDSGLQHQLEVSGLTNYLDHDFGVQAFAFNAAANPAVLEGHIGRITVAPAPRSEELSEVAAAMADSALENIRQGRGSIMATAAPTNFGRGEVFANVTNPEAVSGLDYEFEFGIVEGQVPGNIDTGRGLSDGPSRMNPVGTCEATLDVRRGDGASIFSWAAQPPGTRLSAPLAIRFDGLEASVLPEQAEFEDFVTVAYPGVAEADLPWGAGASFRGFPGTGRPLTPGPFGRWLVHTGLAGDGAASDYSDYLHRVFRGLCNQAAPFDYEIRFTERGSANYDRFGRNGGGMQPSRVPFELWNIGIDSPGESADDVRMIPAIIDWNGDGWGMLQTDHSTSGGSNDPYTDWIYWFEPEDLTPGESGYLDWESSALAGADPEVGLGREVMARMVLVSWNGGAVSEPISGFVEPNGPATGAIVRIESNRPTAEGDSFVLSTAGLEPTELSLDSRLADLEQIGISPNPYRATSLYAQRPGEDRVRFTGLPREVEIRVFTTAGSLVKTFRKDGPERWLAWDLTNEDGRQLASGIYLISFETDLGPVVRKFGVLRARR